MTLGNRDSMEAAAAAAAAVKVPRTVCRRAAFCVFQRTVKRGSKKAAEAASVVEVACTVCWRASILPVAEATQGCVDAKRSVALNEIV